MKRKFEEEEEDDNNGASWKRGKLLGKGGFGSVYLALSKNSCSIYPPFMAVKSAEYSESASLQKEKEVFDNLYGCPHILRCYGEETTVDRNGVMFYNVLLELASGGTLARYIKDSGSCGLPELEIKRYTWCILKGIHYIHSLGFVHCDLKPDNLLLVDVATRGFVDDLLPKIADFGLAKNKKRKISDSSIGGTALYLAPETLVEGVQDFPSDIWALGCIVYEMFTGKGVWDSKPDETTEELMTRIADRYELPVIPSGISKDGRDFLKACLVKKAEFRFTAEMLLNHPFMSGVEEAMRSEYGERLEEGCVSDDCSDSSCSEDWSSYKESDEEFNRSINELTDRGYCNGQNTLGVAAVTYT